jgi:hypothetical protein
VYPFTIEAQLDFLTEELTVAVEFEAAGLFLA